MHTQYSYDVKKLPFLISTVHDDIIAWNSIAYNKYILNNFWIDDDIPLYVKKKIITLVH